MTHPKPTMREIEIGDIVIVHKPTRPIRMELLHKIYTVVAVYQKTVVGRNEKGEEFYFDKDEVEKVSEEKWYCSRHQLRHGQKYPSCHPKKAISPQTGEGEKNTCCDKCHDVDTEHTYPAHTITEFCRAPDCECHTSLSDEMEKEFDEQFPQNIYAVDRLNSLMSAPLNNEIKAFLRKQLDLQEKRIGDAVSAKWFVDSDNNEVVRLSDIREILQSSKK